MAISRLLRWRASDVEPSQTELTCRQSQGSSTPGLEGVVRAGLSATLRVSADMRSLLESHC